MAPSSSKKRYSIKLTPGKQKQIVSAIDLLIAHYGETLTAWSELTPEQREQALVHSPQLTRLLGLTSQAGEVERGA